MVLFQQAIIALLKYKFYAFWVQTIIYRFLTLCISWKYDFYEVHLSFNGDTETSDGENSFRISADNKTGIFKIYQGLRWSSGYILYVPP